ncbi:hypothetical protein GJ496_005119 [Pomphorhynchus laevis]|nr:hypothetical protein GJ496_005119 [Pomphorhynchus laevis]
MLSNSAAAPVERVHPLIALDIPRESDVVHNQVESTARQLTLHDIYEIVITWPPALLDPPRCNATNEFVDIMADLYYQASEEVHFQSCSALEAATVLSRCVLQRIESRKTAIIRKAMERRLDLWRNNDFNALFDEARCLQARADLNKYDGLSQKSSSRLIALFAKQQPTSWISKERFSLANTLNYQAYTRIWRDKIQGISDEYYEMPGMKQSD